MDNTETLLIILGLTGFCMVAIAAVGALKEYFSESPEDSLKAPSEVRPDSSSVQVECPGCGGVGIVGPSFYAGGPNSFSKNERPVLCRTCKGGGIIQIDLNCTMPEPKEESE